MASIPLSQIFSTDNAVFKAYLFYSSALVLKMMLMSILTGRKRFQYKAFANPEDAVGIGKVLTVDHVERVRRAHRNDLENIPIFFVSAFIFTLTNPSVYLAKILFQVFTAARFAHTFVYAVVVTPQPARALCWLIGYLIVGYMSVVSLLHFLF